MIGVAIGFMIFCISAIYLYFVFRRILTGQPSPFETLTYIDNYDTDTYQEIINYLEDTTGPSIILKMRFFHYRAPSYWQAMLITKSFEKNSKLEIQVIE